MRIVRGIRKPEGDEGISLIELVIASAMALIVMAAAGSLFISLSSTPKTVTSRFQQAGNAETLASVAHSDGRPGLAVAGFAAHSVERHGDLPV